MITNNEDNSKGNGINLYQRPELNNKDIAEQILTIVSSLVGEWFSSDVPDEVTKDLLFHDVICFEKYGKVVSFIVFTSMEGAIRIVQMGTAPADQGQGSGSALIQYLFEHTKSLGIDRIDVFTVPPAKKPSYESTVKFYQKHGFIIEKEFPGMWNTGAALKMTRNL